MMFRKKPSFRIKAFTGQVNKKNMSTGSANLDSLLGDGLPLGLITHLYGPAGSGKTNICLSSAIACVKNGLEVLYIDTEGSFNIQRFEQIAQGRAKEISKKIYLHRPNSFDEQKDVIRYLEKILDFNFGLVIIDSMVSLYRIEIDGERENILDLSRELGKELAILSQLARKFKIAVLITNQVYSSFSKDPRFLNKEKEIVPVGGDTLLYWPKVILELEKTKKAGERNAVLKKHLFRAEGKSIKLRITNSGIE